jgi:hypothetical protein
MADSNSSSNASVNAKMGLAGWLTLLFVILKLNPGEHLTSPVVDWSWWLVFSPVLIAWGILLVILLGVGLVFAGAALLDWNAKRKRKKDQKATQNMTPGERREYFANKRRR